MKKPVLPPLSAAEQEIMVQIWRLAPTTTLELLEAINRDRSSPISRPTLQTQLTRLEAKGWIKRDDTQRTHYYQPVVAEKHGRKSVISELRSRLFGGSSIALMRCLVESGDISADELKELRTLIDNTSASSKS